MAFSVSPSHSPTGTFVLSVVTTNATTQQHFAKTMPSIMSTATSRPERSSPNSSARRAAVALMNQRETAARESPLATISSSSPIGSETRQ